MNETILRVEHLMMHFGGIKALNDVNLDVQRGSITALIGPNGAGKTTVFNCLTGFYRASGGNILFNTRHKTTNVIQVLGQKFQPGDWINPAQFGQRLFYKMFGGTHLVNRAGLARTFQNIRLFREMSVVENLLVAQHMRVNRNLLAGILNTPAYRRAESDALDRAFYWLEVVDLVECANRLAGEMSYGQQRRLEIARAMCTGPEMICLDEPAAGLNPVETHKLSSIIRFLRDHHDITVLLIEHDMGMVMEISDDIIVLDHGDVIARENPSRSSMMKRSLPPTWVRMKARSPYERTAAGISRGGCVLRRHSGAEAGLLEVNKGETVALIGANGAGKSTLLMSIFGQPRIRSGQILFCGEDISHKSTHYVASGGIAQAPEGDESSRI
jgi:branched-chain amino acid transport system ATP-binding protein